MTNKQLAFDFAQHSMNCHGKASGLVIADSLPCLEIVIGEFKELLEPLGWSYRIGLHSFLNEDGFRLRMACVNENFDIHRLYGHEFSWMGVAGKFSWTLAKEIAKFEAKYVRFRTPEQAGSPPVEASMATASGIVDLRTGSIWNKVALEPFTTTGTASKDRRKAIRHEKLANEPLVQKCVYEFKESFDKAAPVADDIIESGVILDPYCSQYDHLAIYPNSIPRFVGFQGQQAGNTRKTLFDRLNENRLVGIRIVGRWGCDYDCGSDGWEKLTEYRGVALYGRFVTNKERLFQTKWCMAGGYYQPNASVPAPSRS